MSLGNTETKDSLASGHQRIFFFHLYNCLFSRYLHSLFRKKANKSINMARVCEISGKRPQVGNKVSHANNKTKRRFYPNLQKKRFFIPEENKWVTLKVSTKVIKTINQKGVSAVIKEARQKGTLTANV